MTKLLQIGIVALLLASQPSCKTVTAIQAKEAVAHTGPSDYIVTIKVMGGAENFRRLMNALTAVRPPSDLDVHTYSSWLVTSHELNIRYNALTLTGIEKIQRELIKCEGVCGSGIVRL